MRRRGTCVGSWVERLASVTAILVTSSSGVPQTLPFDPVLRPVGLLRPGAHVSYDKRPACVLAACQRCPIGWRSVYAPPQHTRADWRTLSQKDDAPRARGGHRVFSSNQPDRTRPKAEAPRNSRCRDEALQSAWLSHFVGLAATHWAHKHLFACVPSEGLPILRTHVLFITQTRSAVASREDVAAGPLFPVARGRLRRRLGGRPGRVDHRVFPLLVGGLGRPVRCPRGCASASDGSAESFGCAAPGDRCVRGAGLSMSCRWASSRRSVARLLLAGEILRGYAARGGVFKEPLVSRVTVPNGPGHEGHRNATSRPLGRLVCVKKPAASYSPRPLRAKYHRR